MLLEFKIEANSSFWVLAKLKPSTIKSLIRGLAGFFVYTLQSILISGWEELSSILDFDKKSANYTIVNSKVSPSDGGPEIKIDRRIYTKNPEKPLIRDLIVEGLSLARTQKEEFASILSSNNNDINILIGKLEDFVNN